MTKTHLYIKIINNGGIVIESKVRKQKKKTIEDLAKETREARLDLKNQGIHRLKEPIIMKTKGGGIKRATGEIRTKRKDGSKGGFPHFIADGLQTVPKSFGPGTRVL